MSYTITGGFAPTYRSIFYNSTGNEISEIIGYPMHVNVTKQLTDSAEQSLKNSILKNEFSQNSLRIIQIVVMSDITILLSHCVIRRILLIGSLLILLQIIF